MARYPVKIMLDHQHRPFFPFITPDVIVVNESEETLMDLINDRYTKEEVDEIIRSLGTLQRICGTVSSVSELPVTAENGDTYIVLSTSGNNSEYMWINNGWEELGPFIDLSSYYTSSETDNAINNKATDITLAYEQADATNLQAAKDYTDLQISNIPAPDLTNYYTKSETYDKTEIDNKDTNTLTSAKNYTDTQIGNIQPPAVPTALSQLSDDSTHRLVTDTEKTTWNNKSDFSGDYNDLINKPSMPSATEMLRYKGHVASTGDLPSLGQPSGLSVSPCFETTNADSFSETWLNPFKPTQERIDMLLGDATLTAKRAGYTYYILAATCTTQTSNTIKGNRIVIAYNDINQVKIQMLYDRYNWNGTCLFSIDASQDNPVYVYTTPKDEVNPYYAYKIKHWTTSSYDDSLLDSAITSPMILQGFLTNENGRACCFYLSSAIKYTDNAASILSLTINNLSGINEYYKANAYKSIYFTSDNYIWNNGMIFLLPTTANSLNVQKDTTTTQLNDTYTVGSNRDIYRRNENVQWEVWSKAPANLSDFQDDIEHRTVTDVEKSAWNNKSNFSGNYNDLTNKPTITNYSAGREISITNGVISTTLPRVYYGNTVPSNNLGNVGDIYFYFGGAI